MDKPKEVVKSSTEVVNKVVNSAYRYFCDACTGIAFIANDGDAYPKNPICKSCGKPVGIIKKANFIKL